MLTYSEENALLNMSTDLETDEIKTNEQDTIFKNNSQLQELNQRKSIDRLIFYAGTDKAHVISEILEERGWLRTKDRHVTNFTIKWCLAHQVDWNKFQEGKQLINNIPGQLAFSDKINLWYTIRDYFQNKRTISGQQIQNFLAMTFVLDDENEVAEFLRAYKKQNRTWIYKPRYSYAGRGITVIPVHTDLSTIFKSKIGTNNRPQQEPRSPGYLIQQYISRPLLIKGRKFDIRVHWLVAWTKPLLVFYNHNASVTRLSLNLYHEFDYDRSTHLTNLSVQESHSRYNFLQESTGMTMSQLNHYFNQCFRPFHPRMRQDWVMTVMQERMHTIIRHVIRASKDKLTRGAGQFGFFGCDFLLDENFRIWLLEINDNPGVGWGNSLVNTTTKPLLDETLSIVCECLNKHKNQQPLLPIGCLKNYQLIYNEDDDANRLLLDDNQVFTEQLNIRYALKENSPRKPVRRTLPNINVSRASIYPNDVYTSDSNNNILLPLNLVNIENSNSSIVSTTSVDLTPINNTLNILNTTNETIDHDNNIELGSLTKRKKVVKNYKSKSSLSVSPINGSTSRLNKTCVKRTLLKMNTFDIEQKKPFDLLPTIVDKRICMQRSGTVMDTIETSRKENKIVPHRIVITTEHQNRMEKANVNPAKVCTLT
ncbi:unnamed protein product [Adineta steineri]|uniref:ATP-grasp domain-containing protein n=1 Tax=Adineta steineri TaxID=433720 RepID=A0A815J389_9BILA|nr:unnamed protein product [Adineta steineri]CAF3525516.1 unnamed protein product [Adineta steineri]